MSVLLPFRSPVKLRLSNFMNVDDMIKELKRQKRNSLRRIDRQIKKLKLQEESRVRSERMKSVWRHRKGIESLKRSNIIDRIKPKKGNPVVQLLEVLEKDKGISCFRGRN